MGFKGLAILFSSLKIKTHRNVLNLVLFKIPNGQSYFPQKKKKKKGQSYSASFDL